MWSGNFLRLRNIAGVCERVARCWAARFNILPLIRLATAPFGLSGWALSPRIAHPLFKCEVCGLHLCSELGIHFQGLVHFFKQ